MLQSRESVPDRVLAALSEFATRREKAEARLRAAEAEAANMRILLRDIEAAERVLVSDINHPVGNANPDDVAFGDIRREVLAVVREAYPAALKASVVGQRVQARLGVQVHPKTPGMTLTRLKRDGLVELSGKQWRLASPQGGQPHA